MKRIVLAVLFISPVAAYPSAIKECLVKARIVSIAPGEKETAMKFRSESATFVRGHSMGTDCTPVASGEFEVTLPGRIDVKAGAAVELIYRKVSGLTKNGPMERSGWIFPSPEATP